MEFIRATYEIDTSVIGPEERAEALLLEQTVETPKSVAARYPYVRQHKMGRVQRIEQVGENAHQVVLLLPFDSSSSNPAQFLNVLFGNSSLQPDVSLVDFEPPPSIRTALPGPTYGIAGLRDLIGIWHRPLTCGALKPAGLTVDELATICRKLAEGGIDLIKDDHYLADEPRAPFKDRVRACQEAVDEVSARRGERVVYVPNLSGSPDDVRRQAEYARSCGAGALMLTPMIHGLPQLAALGAERMGAPLVAHPSSGGTTAIRAPILLGKLFRLFGADAAIFPNYGGRFGYSAKTCAEIADHLREPWLNIRPSFPVPAGGMHTDRAGELVEFFGRDAVLLVGGSLLASESIVDRTRQFTERVHAAADALPAP